MTKKEFEILEKACGIIAREYSVGYYDGCECGVFHRAEFELDKAMRLIKQNNPLFIQNSAGGYEFKKSKRGVQLKNWQ